MKVMVYRSTQLKGLEVAVKCNEAPNNNARECCCATAGDIGTEEQCTNDENHPLALDRIDSEARR